MKLLICAVKDAKTGFSGLMLEQNEPSALRSFDIGCNKNDEMKKYPNDYSLVCFGSYDTILGNIELNEKGYKIIANASDVVYGKENEI